MSEAAMPDRRTVVGAALVLLAWIAAPGAGEFLLLPGQSVPASSQTLEPQTELVVVTSDRPLVSVHPKRTDNHRTFAMAVAEAGMAASIALARHERQPGPLVPDEPLAFSVVPRGPPQPTTS